MVNNLLAGSFSSIEQATGKFNKKEIKTGSLPESYKSFQEVYNEKSIEANKNISELKFSKHAGERLEERDIELSQEQIKRLENGTKKACEKGIKESLVLMDDMAFIVNTQKKIVITAMSKDTSGENVYTNIDGAVII